MAAAAVPETTVISCLPVTTVISGQLRLNWNKTGYRANAFNLEAVSNRALSGCSFFHLCIREESAAAAKK